MIGTNDISTINSIEDKLTMMHDILALVPELYDPSDVVNSAPHPIGCATTIAGMSMLTFTSSPTAFTKAANVMATPADLLSETDEATMLAAYLYFFPVLAASGSQTVFTGAQVDAIDTTDYETSGANSAFEQLIDFLEDTSDADATTYGEAQTSAEATFNTNILSTGVLDHAALRIFNQTIFSAMAMMTGTNDFNTMFTTTNLYEMFGYSYSVDSYHSLTDA